MDIYQQFHDADSEVFYTSGKLEWTDGKSDLFVPYASYATSTYFLPTFKSTDIIYKDVALGFSSGIGLRASEFIEYGDASKEDDRSLVFDIKAGRRMADVHDYENWFAQASADSKESSTRSGKFKRVAKYACAGTTSILETSAGIFGWG